MVDLPAAAIPAPPLTRSERWRARADSLFVDHCALRYVMFNLHQVTNEFWRSAQPTPWHLRRIKAKGIRTVVNLRGRRDTCGTYVLERRSCEQLGLNLVDFPIRSRDPLDRPTLHAAGELFGRLEYPAVFHCKSGSDRSGFMATLYMFLVEGQPLPDAMDQLALRYGHIRDGKTGIIDHFFERFMAETGGTQAEFYPWVDSRYDPATLTDDFSSNLIANIIVNRILRRE